LIHCAQEGSGTTITNSHPTGWEKLGECVCDLPRESCTFNYLVFKRYPLLYPMQAAIEVPLPYPRRVEDDE
jgi:hypothetical protein